MSGPPTQIQALMTNSAPLSEDSLDSMPEGPNKKNWLRMEAEPDALRHNSAMPVRILQSAAAAVNTTNAIVGLAHHHMSTHTNEEKFCLLAL